MPRKEQDESSNLLGSFRAFPELSCWNLADQKEK
jgi:hypothetical protein